MNPANVRLYGQIATSVLSLVIFAGCLVVSFLLKDPATQSLLVGAAIANATVVVSYWLGSSSGSQKKDDVITESRLPPPAPPPP